MPIFKIKVEFEVDSEEESIESAKTGLFLPNTINKKRNKKENS